MISFKFFGIKLRIEFLFVATITIFLLVDKSKIGLMGIFACVIHEMGHIVLLLLIRCKPKELVFDVIGIKLVNVNSTLSIKKEMCVLVAGSLTNFFIFFTLICFTSSINKIGLFAVINLILGIFNLLPIKKFDGGKILEIILSYFFSYHTTYVVCRIVEILFVTIMLVTVILMIIYNKSGYTLVIMTCYLVLTAVVKLNKN